MAAPGLLTRATDPEGSPLTAVLVAGPANASTRSLRDDGSFTYTPNADFTGTDTFTFVANDGTTDSNPATVTIDVRPVNDPPVNALPGAQSTPAEHGSRPFHRHRQRDCRQRRGWRRRARARDARGGRLPAGLGQRQRRLEHERSRADGLPAPERRQHRRFRHERDTVPIRLQRMQLAGAARSRAPVAAPSRRSPRIAPRDTRPYSRPVVSRRRSTSTWIPTGCLRQRYAVRLHRGYQRRQVGGNGLPTARRDFVFNGGFYDDADFTGTGTRIVIAGQQQCRAPGQRAAEREPTIRFRS